MKLKSNSRHARFYTYITDNDCLPTSFCSYLFRMVGASIHKLLLVLIILASLFAPFGKGLKEGLLFYALAAGFLLLVGAILTLIEKVRNYKPSENVCPTIEWEN